MSMGTNDESYKHLMKSLSQPNNSSGYPKDGQMNWNANYGRDIVYGN